MFGWVLLDLTCDELAQISFGRVTLSDENFFNSKATYECHASRRYLSGVRERHCQGDGSWSDSPPVCKERPLCGPPPSVPHSKHAFAESSQIEFELNLTLSYECFNGYEIQGSPLAVCTLRNNTVNWAGPQFRCQPISCGDPGEIEHGYRETTGFDFTSRVNFFCNEGYVLSGRAIRYCQSSGKWSGALPTCQPVKCPQPSDPKNGRAFYANYTFGEMVTYQCEPDYQLYGPSNRTCQADRTWSADDPQCKIIDCGPLEPFPNGFIEATSTTIGSTIRFVCLDLMVYEGTFNTSTCTATGQWEPFPFPRCMSTCRVPKIENGKVAKHDPWTVLPHRTAINVTCDSDYEFEIDSTQSRGGDASSATSIDVANYNNNGDARFQTIECRNGTWSHAIQCVPARCKTLPPRPKNGLVFAPKTDHGMRAIFKCRDGYTMSGSNRTYCNYGRWNVSSPTCTQIWCPFPGFLENGKILLVGYMGMYEYKPYVKRIGTNKQIQYECDKGYYISTGPPGATCVDGVWSPPFTPTCERFYHPKISRWSRSLIGSSDVPDHESINGKSIQYNRIIENDDEKNIKIEPFFRDQPSPQQQEQQEKQLHRFQRDHQYHNHHHRRRRRFRRRGVGDHRHKRHQNNSKMATTTTAAILSGAANIKIGCFDLPQKPWTQISILKLGKIDAQNYSAALSVDNRRDEAINRTTPAQSNMPLDAHHHHHHNQQDHQLISDNRSSVAHSHHNPRYYPHGTRIKLRCDDGYVSSNRNRSVIKCAKGRWKPELPNCTPAPCITPTIANGHFRQSPAGGFKLNAKRNRARKNRNKQAMKLPLAAGEPVPHNSRIELICDDGYRHHRDDVDQLSSADDHRINIATNNAAAVQLRCVHGSWDSFSSSGSQCIANDCGLPAIANGGYLNGREAGDLIRHGSVVKYSCDDGFIRSTIDDEDRNDGADRASFGSSRLTCDAGRLIPNPNTPLCVRSANQSKMASSDGNNNSNYSLPSPSSSSPQACHSPQKIENALHYFQSHLMTKRSAPSFVSQFADDDRRRRRRSSDARIGERLISIIQLNQNSDDDNDSVRDHDVIDYYRHNNNNGNDTNRSFSMPFRYEHGTEIIFRCVRFAPAQFGVDSIGETSGGKFSSVSASATSDHSPIGASQDHITSSSLIGGDSLPSSIVERSTWIIRCENGNWIGHSFECEEENVEGGADGGAPNSSSLSGSSSALSASSSSISSPPKQCHIRIRDPNILIFDGSSQALIDDLSRPIAHDTLILLRCRDIGRFRLAAGVARERVCRDGHWSVDDDPDQDHDHNDDHNYNATAMDKPLCVGLNQEYDYDPDKPPTIVFKYQHGPVAQTADGKLLVYPDTILHLECLWIRKYGTPHWSWTNADRPLQYMQSWSSDSSELTSSLEYRLTIFRATEQDSGVYTCQTPKSHSHSVEVIVKAVHCPDLMARNHSSSSRINMTNIVGIGNQFNSEIRFSCPAGQRFVLPNNSSVEIASTLTAVCLPSGQWSIPIPDCVVTECPNIVSDVSKVRHHRDASFDRNRSDALPVFNDDNGVTALASSSNTFAIRLAEIQGYNSRQIGSIIVFACPKGFGLSGATSHELRCLPTGEWSGPVPYCREVRCPEPMAPENGFLDPAGSRTRVHEIRITPESIPYHEVYRAGDMVQYQCNASYMLEGNSISICQETGRWSGPRATCVPACNYPGLNHASRLLSEARFHYALGSIIEFECFAGYSMRGNGAIKCIEPGKWSGSIPECVLL